MIIRPKATVVLYRLWLTGPFGFSIHSGVMSAAASGDALAHGREMVDAMMVGSSPIIWQLGSSSRRVAVTVGGQKDGWTVTVEVNSPSLPDCRRWRARIHRCDLSESGAAWSEEIPESTDSAPYWIGLD